MNKIEINACVDLTNNMKNRQLFKPLKDDEIDFSSIVRAIKSNLYKSVDDWAEAISYSWKSKLETHSPSSLEFLVAYEQDKWFKKKVLKIPHNDIDKWKLELAKTTKDFAEVCRLNPQSPAIKSETQKEIIDI